MGHGQGGQPRNEMQPRTRRGLVGTPSKGPRGAHFTRMRCDAAASRRPTHAGTERSRSGTQVAHKQPIDAELKSRDAAKIISEMEASVPLEKELRLAVEAVEMKRNTEGYRRNWHCGQTAASGVERAMAVPCRWCRLYRVAVCITSYVAFFRTSNVYSSNTKQASSTRNFAGYVHTRSSQSPEPESSAREHWTRA